MYWKKLDLSFVQNKRYGNVIICCVNNLCYTQFLKGDVQVAVALICVLVYFQVMLPGVSMTRTAFQSI